MTVDPWREPIYLDASALAKLLVEEPGSDALNAALLPATDVVVSDLALTETALALGRRRRGRRLSGRQASRRQRVAEQLADAHRRLELTPPIHRRAERLLLTSALPLRALDALHVALAEEAGAATFVTYDARLAAVAATHGFDVVPEG